MSEIKIGSIVRLPSGDFGIVHTNQVWDDGWRIYSFAHKRILYYAQHVPRLAKRLKDEEWAQIAEYRLLT